MLSLRPTSLAHTLAAEALAPGDLAVDATCGNGHDTTHLARLVGPQGNVIAFDIQVSALVETRRHLVSAGFDDGRVSFIHSCHSEMEQHIKPSSASLILFNLGYLPGGDHEVTTHSETTASALHAAARVLRCGGLLMVTCYPGHPEGAREADVVEQWMSAAASHHEIRVAKYAQPFTRRPAPILWLASMKTDLGS